MNPVFEPSLLEPSVIINSGKPLITIGESSLSKNDSITISHTFDEATYSLDPTRNYMETSSIQDQKVYFKTTESQSITIIGQEKLNKNTLPLPDIEDITSSPGDQTKHLMSDLVLNEPNAEIFMEKLNTSIFSIMKDNVEMHFEMGRNSFGDKALVLVPGHVNLSKGGHSELNLLLSNTTNQKIATTLASDESSTITSNQETHGSPITPIKVPVNKDFLASLQSSGEKEDTIFREDPPAPLHPSEYSEVTLLKEDLPSSLLPPGYKEVTLLKEDLPASLLPPGYVEENIPVKDYPDRLPTSLLPPGYNEPPSIELSNLAKIRNTYRGRYKSAAENEHDFIEPQTDVKFSFEESDNTTGVEISGFGRADKQSSSDPISALLSNITVLPVSNLILA